MAKNYLNPVLLNEKKSSSLPVFCHTSFSLPKYNDYWLFLCSLLDIFYSNTSKSISVYLQILT